MRDGLGTFSFGWYPGRIVKERPRREAFLERGSPRDLKHLNAYGCTDVVLQLGDSDLTASAPSLVLIKRVGPWAVYQTKTPCAEPGAKP